MGRSGTLSRGTDPHLVDNLIGEHVRNKTLWKSLNLTSCDNSKQNQDGQGIVGELEQPAVMDHLMVEVMAME